MPPTLLLINPWIYDFAAYDLWSKPLGLLSLAGELRQLGFRIDFVDCLDVHHPLMRAHPKGGAPTRRLYGTGKFWRQKVTPPAPLSGIQRPYSRYGLSPEVFRAHLASASKPDAVLVTSMMTYWYPGVKETIRLVRGHHAGVPIILGGIYSRLCQKHARVHMGADHVVSGSGMQSLLVLLQEYGIRPPESNKKKKRGSYPSFDLLTHIDYVCLMTSTGCPFRCRYCASHFLSPVYERRDPGDVLEEILHWHRDFGVRDFAFYDDALLPSSETYLAPLLENVISLDLNLKFHTPNALHVREITGEIAKLMHRSGFRTLRLGLETSDFVLHRALDNKLSEGDFERAVIALKKAGFPGKEIGAYILMGLPGQKTASVMKTIDFVDQMGAMPYLSEYSPIPHTPLWEEAVRCYEYDLTSGPLFHNNTLLPCWDESQRRKVSLLKKRVQDIREKYRSS